MHRAARALVASTTVLVVAVTGAAGSVARPARPVAAERPSGSQRAADRATAARVARVARAAGLQLGAKHRTRPSVTVAGRTYAAPDPALAELPSGSRVDQSYWRRHDARAGDARMASRKVGRMVAPRVTRSVPTAVRYSEREPVGTLGRDDTQRRAERLADLGTGRAHQATLVSGSLFAPTGTVRRIRTREDQGSLRSATHTGLGRHGRVLARISSRIGDGPHGRRGDRHGDFDFYRLRAARGTTISADTRGSELDSVLAVYDARGHVLSVNDDEDGSRVTSALAYPVTETGTYFVAVAGFSERGSLPANPARSGSGAGRGDRGRYRLHLSVRPVDHDFYAVQLRSGDVLGATLTGHAFHVSVHRVDGAQMVGSDGDPSSAYPSASPLPGGGSSLSYVAEQPGWYSVSVDEGSGAYRLLLETYRPGSETAPVQTVFLDFDGARLNTAVFGGPGVRTLSPMRAFLARWGLTPADEAAVADATVASVEGRVATLRAHGLDPRLQVHVLDSRHDPDPWGQPDVSRVVVGGTIAETGVPTIGIAQSIDPGNFAHEETAMVLLDEISQPVGAPDSLATYLGPTSDRAAFVGRVLGNLAAHEVGHMIGSFHTDNSDRTTDLMDSGGGSFERFFGVGADRVGGTADDTTVDFGEDAFAPDEGFTGLEDTLNNSSWAFAFGS